MIKTTVVLPSVAKKASLPNPTASKVEPLDVDRLRFPVDAIRQDKLGRIYVDGLRTNAANVSFTATARVLGRITAGAGLGEELSGSDLRTIAGLATTDSPTFTTLTLTRSGNTYLSLRSANGYAGYVYWVESGAAERGILGFRAGSAVLEYRPAVSSFSSGTTVFSLSSTNAEVNANLRVTAFAAPTSGKGVEIGYLAGTGAVTSYDRDAGGGYKLLSLNDGLVLTGGYTAITVGIRTLAALAALAINGGLHVGGDSDPGDNNLLVDGITQSGGYKSSDGSDGSTTTKTVTAGATVTIKNGLITGWT